MAKKKKKYPASQVLTAAAGYSAGKATAKAATQATAAARAAGRAVGKRLKKAAGGKRRGPQDAVMPKVTAARKKKKAADEAKKPASQIKKAVKGMYPFNVVRKLTGK